jgi:glutamyl-tRNA synthetase
VIRLVKERASSIPQLADEAMLFYIYEVKAPPGDWGTDALKALRTLKARLVSVPWERAAINDTIKDVAKTSGLKMPQVAMPLRHIVTGRTQTPSIDAVLELLGREMVLTRLAQHLEID